MLNAATEKTPSVPEESTGVSAQDLPLQLALTAALERMNAGDPIGALAHLQPVEALASTRDIASYVFGLFYFNTGETERALVWFDRALHMNPNFPQALTGRAVALQRVGRPEEALGALEAILRLEPTDHEALYMSGVILHGLDRRQEALFAYDAALRQKPDYREALTNRGVLLEQVGQFEPALASFDAALALGSEDTTVHFNRGSVLQRLGRFEEALAAYDHLRALGAADLETELNRGNVLQKLGRLAEAVAGYDAALKLRPLYPQALYNRGIALHRLGCPVEALESFDAALALKPVYPEALCNRGNVLNELRRYAEALSSYEAALRLRPDFAQAQINRANVLFESGRYEEAIESSTRILLNEPDHPQALCVRGAALHRLDRFEEALEALDHALRSRPEFPEAWLNRGNVQQELGQLEAALESYDRALAFRPNYAEVLSSRGVALKELGFLSEALASFDEALRLKPDFPDARNNLAGALLLGGDLKQGFDAYESRWDRSNAPRKTLYSSLPTWRGEPLAGRRILVWDEQGLGDLIQFSRYLPMLADLGAEVTLLSRPAMFPLLGTLPRVPHFIEAVADEGAYDYQIALMSLPHAFGTTLGSIPAQLPYLYAEPQRVAHWASRIGGDSFRIGICWHGNAKINLERSIPLTAFAPLAAIEGVRLISLMREADGDANAHSSAVPIETLGPDFDTGPHAFLDTAAAMAHLDLIVTSDTAIAHLAGALGRPTYVALKRVPDWRWLMKGERSPWYPTLRLYRQTDRGDWRPVFDRIAACVEERMHFPKD